MGNPTKKLPMIERDGWLLPVEKELTARHESYLRALREIVSYTHLTLPTKLEV